MSTSKGKGGGASRSTRAAGKGAKASQTGSAKRGRNSSVRAAGRPSKAARPLVGILMGSASDLEVMGEGAKILEELGIAHEVVVTSAHRSPAKTAEYASTARDRGLQVLIVGAGVAAHLAGAVAGITTLPVLGVPLDSGPLRGMDALLSTVQMPAGVPVGTLAIGAAGARNAALLAAQILSLSDERLARAMADRKKKMADAVPGLVRRYPEGS
ncbi:MAG TPA: 5-(carboxyamino)imidazole ribonucleotide mutase [Candidatus Limnocylindrales bacterium]|nr:5-(carboxyamino)imidazole ribonucleotide mutase [Candidatus Limnocylindrales bacterium]